MNDAFQPIDQRSTINIWQNSENTLEYRENHFHQQEWYDMAAAVDMVCV